MLKEFRDFISKGNVMDLAVGIIIGAAFTAIVSSFVKDVVTPIIGLLGKASLENDYLVLKAGPGGAPVDGLTLADAQKTGAVVMSYGVFLNAVINFFLVALVVFMLVKAVNKVHKKPDPAPAAPPEPTNEEKLLTEIRDLLKAK
jgi:large conductance mechanosensitive channel